MCVVHRIPQFSSAIHKIRAELHPSAAHIVCLYRFWGERFDLHIVKVYSSVLLVYANLIFALLVCQSYLIYRLCAYRISVLYDGDHNVDSNILSYIGAYIPMSLSEEFICPKVKYMHSSFDAFSLRD